MSRKDLLELLRDELSSLERAREVLQYSYDTCNGIGIKEDYTFDEMDRFEALTSRFARLSDLLIQKIFRLIDQIGLEDSETVRDRINNAEKKGLIESADIFIQIRIVMNDIAHEYHTETLKDIYKKVLELSPCLFDSIKRVKKYCMKYSSI
ncbi:MAG: hypothetical protein AYP45_08110 [Candidatus Brocadia carolinensis]|uniref:DUF86 domain-containing protein n=1 Tax=Candidatus Brocadia carolinensis TaxID=1004156 RepID=A0A1V4AU01_9BACT|nr:MAG: hypothetical protein AYP45_08110 [Candidatus Brocadia caroliniensis]